MTQATPHPMPSGDGELRSAIEEWSYQPTKDGLDHVMQLIEQALDAHAEAYARATMDYITNKLNEDGRDKEFHHSDLKTRHALVQLIAEECAARERAARIDERENMKFINPQTGVEIHGPYLQYRYAADGLLLSWEDRTAQLTQTQKGNQSS